MEKVCFPTLSELIEACGSKFSSLEFFKEKRFAGFNKEGKQWWANSHRETEECKNCKNEKETKPCIKSPGDTPEEAVAQLWLAIHRGIL